MELNITDNLVKVLVRQRDMAMSKCAELEAKLLTVSERLAEYENKEHAKKAQNRPLKKLQSKLLKKFKQVSLPRPKQQATF